MTMGARKKNNPHRFCYEVLREPKAAKYSYLN